MVSLATELHILNRAVPYVIQNEQTNQHKIVHVYQDEDAIPVELAEPLRTLDHLYPQIRIDSCAAKGSFGPESIEALSRRLHVPKNQMFIGTPG